MKVEKNKVVSFHYVLKDDNACVLDSSYGGEPLTFTFGCGQILPGLEEAMHGRAAGNNFSVTIPPEKAYGLRDKNKIRVLDRSLFGSDPIFVGMEFKLQLQDGSEESEQVLVMGINEGRVTVDGNHVMAGARLNFDINIVAIKEAFSTESRRESFAECEKGESKKRISVVSC